MAAQRDSDDRKSRTSKAQASLDQVRHQAGGALSGDEVAERAGLAPEHRMEDPPLDWRLTPRNVLLQIVGLVLFVVAVWFIIDLAVSGVWALFGGGGV